MDTVTLTRAELESWLEKTIRDYQEVQTLYENDPECAVFNTISGIVEGIELRDMFKQFDQCIDGVKEN